MYAGLADVRNPQNIASRVCRPDNALRDASNMFSCALLSRKWVLATADECLHRLERGDGTCLPDAPRLRSNPEFRSVAAHDGKNEHQQDLNSVAVAGCKDKTVRQLLAGLLNLAVEVSAEAGHLIRKVKDSGDLGLVDKGGGGAGGMQTRADRAAQVLIARRFSAAFPEVREHAAVDCRPCLPPKTIFVFATVLRWKRVSPRVLLHLKIPESTFA